MSDLDRRLQLLGFAFAGADVVFDVGADGRIGLCLGAAENLTGASGLELQQKPWLKLFAATEHKLVEAAAQRLTSGDRLGPLCVQLDDGLGSGRYANLSLFRLPQRPGWTSCALSRGAPGVAAMLTRRDDGLIEASAFEGAADALLTEASQTGQQVSLELLELPGLQARVAQWNRAKAQETREQVSATLRAQAFRGRAVSEVAPDRFALICTGELDAGALLAELQVLAGGGIEATHQALAVDVSRGSGELRAVRYALNRFVEETEPGPCRLTNLLAETLDEAVQFRRRLAEGDFALHYQPIVSLCDSELHHFEALVRFAEGVSPAKVISMAEDLDLITDFDLAVAKQSVRRIANCASSIAVNISAASLCRPAFQRELLGLTSHDRRLRRRLLLELTETQALADLDEAAEALRALREAGHAICLDDFGAGAASIDYLRRLPLDFIKVDGRYVRSSDTAGRDRLILRRIVELCHDLRLPVIAECVESADVADGLRAMQVEYAQGWFFGKPTPQLTWQSPAPPALARRRGVVESWS